MKKYELTSNTKTLGDKTLYQIRALIDFGNVKAGDLGGYIEKEDNLSHADNAWVSGNAKIYGNARVRGGAKVSGNAQVYGDAQIYGNARVRGGAKVSGDAQIYGNARVRGGAKISGDAQVYGNTDYLTIGPIGSRDDFTTFYCRKDGIIMVVCGCFHGTIDEFAVEVAETHEDNEHAAAYHAAIQIAKVRIRTQTANSKEE